MMDRHPGLVRLGVQRIESSLHQTVWRLAGPGARARAFVLLEDGEARLESPHQHSMAIVSPSLLWLVRPDGVRLRAEAGSTGYMGLADESFLAQLNVDYADATILGFAANRDHQLSLAGAEHASEAGGIFAALYRELRSPRIGSRIIIAAQLRILLVTLLRLGNLDVSLEGVGAEARFLQRFRALVEANFRSRWPVRRYAEQIGISHDRLHSLCTRKLGRTPKALIAERLAREATLGLERSTLSIEQLSHSLGFSDPAHFSHFFKRIVGLPPGAYRARIAGGLREAHEAAAATFADWP